MSMALLCPFLSIFLAFMFFLNFYFIFEDNIYNIVLASAVHQHESVIGTHMPPPSWTFLLPPSPSHPSRFSQSTRFGFPASYSKFPLVIYFAYGNVYISMLLSHVIPSSSTPTVSKNLSFICASPLLPCI